MRERKTKARPKITEGERQIDGSLQVNASPRLIQEENMSRIGWIGVAERVVLGVVAGGVGATGLSQSSPISSGCCTCCLLWILFPDLDRHSAQGPFTSKGRCFCGGRQ